MRVDIATGTTFNIRTLLRRTLGVAGLLLTAWVLAVLPLNRAVLLAGGLTAIVLLVRWPWLVWLPLAAALPFTSAVKVGPASATDLLFAAAIILWFVDGARRRALPLHASPLFVAACIYTAAQFVSTFVAVNLSEALAEVIKWVELCAVLLIAPAMLAPRQIRWVAAALVTGAVGQALLGLYQFIFQIGPEFFVILGRFMRAYGTFAQPNPFGGFLGLTLPIALSLALWAWQTLFRRSGMRWAALGWALFFTGATAVIGAGLLASWSRGAWLGAAVSVIMVLVLHSRTVAVLTGIGALLVAMGLLLGALTPNLVPAPIAARVQDVPAYFGLTDVLSQPVTDENFSVVERVAHWVAAQRMWEQSPWLGVGPGNYSIVYPQVRLPKWEEPLGHAHNVYLNVLGETGLLGFTAYLILMVTAFGWTWRQFRQAQHQHRAGAEAAWFAALAVGLLGMLAHLTMHNVVDNLFVQGMVLYIGLWLALLPVDGSKRRI